MIAKKNSNDYIKWKKFLSLNEWYTFAITAANAFKCSLHDFDQCVPNRVQCGAHTYCAYANRWAELFVFVRNGTCGYNLLSFYVLSLSIFLGVNLNLTHILFILHLGESRGRARVPIWAKTNHNYIICHYAIERAREMEETWTTTEIYNALLNFLIFFFSFVKVHTPIWLNASTFILCSL